MAREKGRTAWWRRARVAALVLAVVVACLAAFVLLGHHEPDATALAALESDEAVQVEQVADGYAFVGPDEDPDNTYGLVFYPGAKVDERAYAPLLHQLAAKGWVCVDVSMPLDLAILDEDAATQAMAEFPQVEHWYVAGHSLGGAMAADFAADHADELDGLVLLAAYSTKDLSDSGLEVLSAYGTRDGVLNREKYHEDRQNLPRDAHELVILGGNHAQFGSYGTQLGDGEATIGAYWQVEETVRFIDGAKRDGPPGGGVVGFVAGSGVIGGPGAVGGTVAAGGKVAASCTVAAGGPVAGAGGSAG